MRVQGISQYGGLYGSYPVREIPVVPTQEVRRQDEQKTSAGSSVQEAAAPQQDDQIRNKASRNADLQNLSLTFRSADDYGYIGKDSSIESLDVKKAVSDMQKDSVLQQYQTFVGGSDMVLSSEDGMVIRK